MSIEILNEFVILSIKHDLLKNIEYKSLISNFVVKTVCKVIFQYIYFFKDRMPHIFALSQTS